MTIAERQLPGLERSPAVTVNSEACARLARLLSAQEIPLDREDTALPELSPEQIGNFYFWLVAICHQTSPRGLPPLMGTVQGQELRGWDYLSAKFLTAVQDQTDLLTPRRWSETTGRDLATLFRDPITGERLTQPDERAVLVRNLGQVMLKHEWRKIDDLYRLSEGRIKEGTPNLLNLLSEFRAYDDPVRKKSYFLLGLMRNTGLWTYVDNENLGAPVDYHEVRGHLRIGTVIVNDAALAEKLLQGEPVTKKDDVAIRSAVHDAIMLLSKLTGLNNPSQLHYLFWNVFRSCCARTETHCTACPSNCALPQRYVHLAIHPDSQRRCPFSDVCQSAGKTPKYLEHSFSTDYY